MVRSHFSEGQGSQNGSAQVSAGQNGPQGRPLAVAGMLPSTVQTYRVRLLLVDTLMGLLTAWAVWDSVSFLALSSH